MAPLFRQERGGFGPVHSKVGEILVRSMSWRYGVGGLVLLPRFGDAAYFVKEFAQERLRSHADVFSRVGEVPSVKRQVQPGDQDKLLTEGRPGIQEGT